MAAPWTQSLSVRWRPELRFYEERIEILRSLEDAAVLRAFAVGDDQIGARILAPGHALTVRQDGLVLDLIGQTDDFEMVWDHASAAVKRLAPTRIREAAARFAHIEPIELPFEDAVARSVDRLLPPVGATDYAMLMDLAAPGDVRGQMEFGIVRASEAGPRLRGIGVRIAPISPALREHDWRGTKFPDVSLFADSSWRETERTEHEHFEDVRDVWLSARDGATSIVEALHRWITSSENARKGMNAS